MSITRYKGISALAMQPESTEWEPAAVMEQADDGAWVLYKDHAAEIEALKEDAARWRWARQNDLLWSGTYDYGHRGETSPEDSDEIADAEIAAMKGEK